MTIPCELRLDPNNLIRLSEVDGQEEDLIRAEQIKLAYASIPTAIAGGLLGAVVLVVVLWPIVEQTILVGWLAGISLINAYRAWLKFAYKQENATSRESEVWGRRFLAISLIAGFGWGSTGIFLFPADSVTHQAFLAMVLAGISTAAYTTLSAIFVAVVAFVYLCLLPLVLNFFLLGTSMGTAMGVLGATLLFSILLNSKHIHNSLIQNITLRIKVAKSEECLKKSHNDLLLSEARFERAVLGSDAGIWEWNLVTDKVYLAPGFKRLLGYDNHEMEDFLFRSWIHQDDRQGTLSAVHHSLETGESFNAEYRLPHRDGEYRWFSGLGKMFYGDNGNITYFTGVITDITERRQDAEIIKRQADQDELTNLSNRRSFLRQLTQVIAQDQRRRQKGALLYMDLDNFKNVNDSLGHHVGDDLLIQFSNRLRKNLRAEDTVARLGGDEFVVLMPGFKNGIDEVSQVAQRTVDKIRQSISDPFVVHNHSLRITTSIGIADYPKEGESANDVLRNADTAMYTAKESGGNCTCFYSPKMQELAQRRLRLQNELQRAIDKKKFKLFFQPIVNVESEVVGVEALLRWKNEYNELIAPKEFIRLAEESGQILEIGYWVLESALEEYKKWKQYAKGSRLNYISVNISPIQFRQKDFVKRVEKVMDRSCVNPDQVLMEITENLLIKDVDNVVLKMHELRALGVQFSVDDFGTGYSSLSYLSRLPVCQLKVDRHFVHNIHTNSSYAKLVEIIQNLASHLDLYAVAEGVEDASKFEFLKSIGCKYFQGFYFSPPMSGEDIIQYFDGKSERKSL